MKNHVSGRILVEALVVMVIIILLISSFAMIIAASFRQLTAAGYPVSPTKLHDTESEIDQVLQYYQRELAIPELPGVGDTPDDEMTIVDVTITIDYLDREGNLQKLEIKPQSLPNR